MPSVKSKYHQEVTVKAFQDVLAHKNKLIIENEKLVNMLRCHQAHSKEVTQQLKDLTIANTKLAKKVESQKEEIAILKKALAAAEKSNNKVKSILSKQEQQLQEIAEAV